MSRLIPPISPICGCMRTFRLWDCRQRFSHLTGQLKRCHQGAPLTEIKSKLFIKVTCDRSSPLNEITLYRPSHNACLGRPLRVYRAFDTKLAAISPLKSITYQYMWSSVSRVGLKALCTLALITVCFLYLKFFDSTLLQYEICLKERWSRQMRGSKSPSMGLVKTGKYALRSGLLKAVVWICLVCVACFVHERKKKIPFCFPNSEVWFWFSLCKACLSSNWHLFK